MVVPHRERALSELIGFILLLALLILVSSLYLTYVVPAHGREGEIAHMDYIKGQFLDYKISTDALWINREYNVPIAQAITLGTQGVKTAGMFAGFQLFTPVFSSGELSVNNSDATDTLTISVANPLWTQVVQGTSPSVGPVILNQTTLTNSEQFSYNELPARLNIRFITDKTLHEENPKLVLYKSEFPKDFGLNISNNDQYNKFGINISAVPRLLTSDFNWSESKTPRENNSYWIRYETDIELSITVNNTNILERYVVYSDIDSNKVYEINLLDPAYGFVQKLKTPFNLTTQKFNETGILTDFDFLYEAISQSYNEIGSSVDDQYFLLRKPPYQIKNAASMTNIGMGKLEFRSHNVYYRTQQNFIYQLGGIFVNQSDGSSPLNLPLISINPQPGGRVWNVDVTSIKLLGNTYIGGSSPVQVQTTLDSLSEAPFDSSKANSAFVALTVDNCEDPGLWKLIFNSTARNAGIAEGTYLVSNTSKSATMIILGPERTSNTTRDIKLRVTNVDLRVELDAVGKAIGI